MPVTVAVRARESLTVIEIDCDPLLISSSVVNDVPVYVVPLIVVVTDEIVEPYAPVAVIATTSFVFDWINAENFAAIAEFESVSVYVADGTTEDGTFSVIDTDFVPIMVLPEYVSQYSVPTALVAFGT